MSSKRRADKELTSDNWDAEDEPEEKGNFRVASEDVLKNRIIRTAKRRITNGAADNERPSIFSGFTGFGNKTSEEKKTSFSFVSNDLKGEDTVKTIKNTTPEPKFSFSTAPTSSAKPCTFSLASNTSNSSTIDSSESIKSSLAFKKDLHAENATKLSTLSKKLKSVTSEKQSIESKNTDTASDEVFVKKLHSLNLLCAEWIIKHLNENLSYILTPIFDDYKKHLTQLREERRLASSTCKKAKIEVPETKVTMSEPQPTRTLSIPKTISKETAPKVTFGLGSFLSSKENDTSKLSKPALTLTKEQTSGFKFFSSDKKDENSKTFNFTPTNTKSDSLSFNFKAGSESTSTAKASDTNSTDTKSDSAMFQFKASSFGTNSIPSTEPLPPSFFSFKPSTSNSMFGQNVASKAADTATENEDDCPPPVVDVTITEEGSVYNKKCKIFIKKDGNFVDHGVGFLFVKLVGDEQKCQVIVRANNKLANILMNVLLSPSVPIQKMGKNNLIVVCCPTPETKQPTSVLIKVKTAEDAEELFNTLNKYRK